MNKQFMFSKIKHKTKTFNKTIKIFEMKKKLDKIEFENL